MDAVTAKHPLISRAITLCGRQHDLASAMECSQQRVSKLLNLEIPVTAEDAVAIHRATKGEVPAHELRPDLFSPDYQPPVQETAA